MTKNSDTLEIVLLMEKVVRGAYRLRRSKDIQPLQWSILRTLKNEENAQSRQQIIVKELGLTPAPVSRAIKTLVSKGLVVQENDASDARGKLLSLTAQGVEILREDPMVALAKSITDLDGPQKIAFEEVLQKLAK